MESLIFQILVFFYIIGQAKFLIMYKFFLIFIIIISGTFIPLLTKAAILYFEPAERSLQPGETFIEEIRIDTERECINAVAAKISFSKETLEAIDFSLGNSILTLWVEFPTINQNQGLISFAGGVPGGYCGELPGIEKESNLLGRVIFKVKKEDDFTLKEGRFGQEQLWARIKFLDDTQVLLNDGRGTKAKLIKKGVVFPILFKEIKEEPEDIWKKELEQDQIPPEPFLPQISKDPNIYQEKYFLTFSTTDKQTGIDYFLVGEQKRIMLGIWGKEKKEIAKSPYLLKDQGLRSKITVIAVDKAGNKRVEIIMPKIGWQDLLPWIVIILMIVVLIWWTIKKVKIKKEK